MIFGCNDCGEKILTFRAYWCDDCKELYCPGCISKINNIFICQKCKDGNYLNDFNYLSLGITE